MAYLIGYLFVILVVTQTVGVFSRQFDLDEFLESQNEFGQRPTKPSRVPTAGTTTTTPSPIFTECFTTCPTLTQYAPVCGSDSVSYHNKQKLDCAKKCGLDVEQLHIGTCRPAAGGK